MVGVNVSCIRSADHLHDPGTTGPVTLPWCSAAYISIPPCIDPENVTVMDAPVGTPELPPVGMTLATTVLKLGATALPQAAIATATAPSRIADVHMRMPILQQKIELRQFGMDLGNCRRAGR
jgi:hypothetical protein